VWGWDVRESAISHCCYVGLANIGPQHLLFGVPKAPKRCSCPMVNLYSKDEDEEGQSRTTITYIYAYVFYGFYGSSMI